MLKYLHSKGMIHGDCMTVTGKTMAENLATVPGLAEGQQVIMPLEKPIKETGHLQILYGNLAPGGSVAKITGKVRVCARVGGWLVRARHHGGPVVDEVDRGQHRRHGNGVCVSTHPLVRVACTQPVGMSKALCGATQPPVSHWYATNRLRTPHTPALSEDGHIRCLTHTHTPHTTPHHTNMFAVQEGLYFKGIARVFDCEEDMLDALSKDPPSFKGTVIVIRCGSVGHVWHRVG